MGAGLSFCLSCRHFTSPLGPQGACRIWQRTFSSAEASIHRCSLWDLRRRPAPVVPPEYDYKPEA